MLTNLYTLASGKAAACDGKEVYITLEKALAAALAHNRWEKRRHNVEAYKCPFCDNYHKGRVSGLAEIWKIMEGGV